MPSLRLEDFSDREFLFAVDDSIGEKGNATAAEIQETFQLEHKNATLCIGSRLSHMSKLGLVDKATQGGKPMTPCRWSVTKRGHNLMGGVLRESQVAAIKHITPQQISAAVEALGSMMGSVDPKDRQIMRREWRHQEANSR